MCSAVVPGAFFQRPVDCFQSVCPGFLGTRLHVGFVDLYNIGAGSEQVADLVVDGGGVVHRRQFPAAIVVVDLRLLRHRERPGTVTFTRRCV